MAIRLHLNLAVHPGVWLRREIVEPVGLSVAGAARRLHVTRHSMSKLLNDCQRLSADMAIRFGKAFGVTAETLVRMQAAHEFAEARAHENANEVEKAMA